LRIGRRRMRTWLSATTSAQWARRIMAVLSRRCHASTAPQTSSAPISTYIPTPRGPPC
jgi:hypothetical protein